MNDRRHFIKQAIALPLATAYLPENVLSREETLKITEMKVHFVRINERGNWVFVEILTNKGIVGLGEASHAVKALTSKERDIIGTTLRSFFHFVNGKSPSAINAYKVVASSLANTSKVHATAYSAIEQALWDITAKALDVPVHELFGGKIRDQVKVYANINRATNQRDGLGRRLATAFQRSAEHALRQGFTAIKLAPFDEMKPLPSSDAQIGSDIDHAISCIQAVRNVIGKDIDLLVDVHSHLNESLSKEVMLKLKPLDLYWFEEPVDPAKFLKETVAITATGLIRTAGGESIFSRSGFAPLIESKAYDVIMPDVKHCGGLQELSFIAAHAAIHGVTIAPHNPSGPVSTAATVQLVSTIPNFEILEYALGEVEWRHQLLSPEESFAHGHLYINDRPGIGHTLNPSILKKHEIA